MQPITLHSFDGGIHPKENKDQSTQSPIVQLPVPSQLIVPLGQHIGAPAESLVQAGDKVLKGQMIAKPKGFVSAAIHAPTSGTISSVEMRELPHSSGLLGMCAIIDSDGKDQWIEHQGIEDYLEADNQQLIDKIRDSGITGLGGAGFPTSVKVSIGERKIDTLIINAAECEPYITADDMLMRERALDAIKGIQILMKLTGAEDCLVGIEDNKPQAIKAMKDALHQVHGEHHIVIATIPTKYPSGGEKQLIQILTGKEVPSAGIPADIGIVCQNVGTSAAVYKAVALGEPLISRITTITGDAIKHPQNVEVLIGTPVKNLLEFASFKAGKKQRLIMGGPVMGFTLKSDELPVIKATNCILAPTARELPANDYAMACIRCGMCTEACPADLLPQQLYWFAKSDELEKAEQHNIFDCIECGACSYVCPSQIPLVQYYRYAKGAIKEDRATKEKAERSKIRFENRQARLDREAAEKEAKRKARAEAAEKAQAAKKAAAAAAPDSADAKAAPAPAASPQDLEKLQKQLDAAQTALKKTMDKIADAKENAPDKVEAFEKAMAKTRDKVKTLAKDIAAAKKAAAATPAASTGTDTDKGDPNSPQRLEKKWQTAQARLETAQRKLKEAQEQGLDTVEALRTGVEKQQARVDDAKNAFEAASNSSTETTAAVKPAEQVEGKPTAPAVDIEALEKKLRAQQDRVAKTQERINLAKEQGLDTVDALQKGLDKQMLKLNELEQQISEQPINAAKNSEGA